MPKSGVTFSPNFATKKVGEVIKGLGAEFTEDDVVIDMAADFPEISPGTVVSILANKVRQGVLTKDAGTLRKNPDKKFTESLPKAVIAEELWGILLEWRARARSIEDLTIEAERRVGKRMGMTCLRLPTQTYTLLRGWEKGGYLRRFGWERGDNSYQLLPGVNVRPPSRG